ncbi:MAG TPA: pyridoxal 5'-phosphate synthase glutaminase subunit PdxT [Actinomycetota bacterium]|jgi:5'-phosphate synthase pdxT subunit|nr:pyridoxal 5'-phosphate synthase glutaminase subunit PdxT [Actinomycetota bacterium]
MVADPRIGVLALQGDFAEHLAVLESCGYRHFTVRSCMDLEQADALIIPGGESTTMLKLVDRYELRDAMVKRVESGMPVFGTCAGAIVLADRVSDGERTLGVWDMHVERNAYGRQAESFEADIEVSGLDEPVRGIFIRAPIITGAVGTTVMATHRDQPVLVRKDNLLAATFHPELAGETRIHRWFVENLCAGKE